MPSSPFRFMGFSLLSEMEFFAVPKNGDVTQQLTTRYAGARRLLYKKITFPIYNKVVQAIL